MRISSAPQPPLVAARWRSAERQGAPADEWKGRLREDVLERVRANRVAILSRARGEGASGASLRDEVDVELRQILSEALGRASRGGPPPSPPPPVRTLACTTQSAAADAPGDPGPGYSRDRGLRLAPPSSFARPATRRRRHVGRRTSPSPRARRSLTTWGEAGHGRPERGGVRRAHGRHAPQRRRNFAPGGGACAGADRRVRRAPTSTQPWKISPTGARQRRVRRGRSRGVARCRARRLLQTSGTIFAVRTISPSADGASTEPRVERRGKFRARSPAASVGRRLRRAREGRVRERKPGVRGSGRVRAEVLYAECPRCRFLGR